MENTETTIVENNAEVISQPIKKKSNKKVVIFTTVIAIVVLGIVAAVIAIVAGNSNSLWKKPFDEESGAYGYRMMPEEFVEKANTLKTSDSKYHEFQYNEKNTLDVDGKTVERQDYSIRSYDFEVDSLENYGFLSNCLLDYYDDDTIRQTVLVFSYNGVWPLKYAYDDISVSATQILYAYGAFEAEKADDVLNAFNSLSDALETTANETTRLDNIFLRYNDFVIKLYEDEESRGLFMVIQKSDEDYIKNMEEKIGFPLINLGDSSSSNNTLENEDEN